MAKIAKNPLNTEMEMESRVSSAYPNDGAMPAGWDKAGPRFDHGNLPTDRNVCPENNGGYRSGGNAKGAVSGTGMKDKHDMGKMKNG